ncbi:PTS mannose transporter subunit IID [Rossellomorea vietnamensis]|uniref:PTS mannose transporter subunit IID n=1 Tax=Rossellomorea vietnamensis TaxID=218284 RepID=A0A5D4MDG8_9BACI|nr:PTS mannose transporter subunit IID [Rossellomorea vietnamensis]TYR99065.1 PTS mannose transporter subunit IID [Rossellomorea vietnamensis]
MKKDIFTLVGGFLSAMLLFLGSIDVSFDWFTQTSIDAFVILLAAAVALGLNLYAIWRNTFVSKEAQLQKKALQAKGLIKK